MANATTTTTTTTLTTTITIASTGANYATAISAEDVELLTTAPELGYEPAALPEGDLLYATATCWVATLEVHDGTPTGDRVTYNPWVAFSALGGVRAEYLGSRQAFGTAPLLQERRAFDSGWSPAVVVEDTPENRAFLDALRVPYSSVRDEIEDVEARAEAWYAEEHARRFPARNTPVERETANAVLEYDDVPRFVRMYDRAS